MTRPTPNPTPEPFDEEESALMQALDQGLADGTLVSHLTPEQQAELQASARATMNPPKKHISARLPERDLQRLKAMALAQGIPYHTLLTSIVHRYVEGSLVEKT